MPGEVSLRTNQYYNNPTNQFWKIISYITNEEFDVSYEVKKKLLLKHHIAVWDVLMHCEREGSSDIAINEEFPNDFADFYKKYPAIKYIFFNGNKPSTFYKNLVGIDLKKNILYYPVQVLLILLCIYIEKKKSGKK